MERKRSPNFQSKRYLFQAEDISTAQQLFEKELGRVGLRLAEKRYVFAELDSMLGSLTPSLIQLEEGESSGWLLVIGRSGLGRRGQKILLLTKEGQREEVSVDSLSRFLTGPVEQRHRERLESICRRDGGAADELLESAILKELGKNDPLCRIWTIEEEGSFFEGRIQRQLLALLVTHFSYYVLFIASWAIIGGELLRGAFDAGWFIAWILALCCALPVRAASVWMENLLAISLSTFVRQRLLRGILQVRPELIHQHGSGGLLGLIFEAEALESLAISGGLLLLVGGVEFLATLSVFAFGFGSLPLLLLLFVWSILLLLFIGKNYLLRSTWVRTRLSLTTDFVERLLGHRTRLVQLHPSEWHRDEDQPLAAYYRCGKPLDRSDIVLESLLGRGWGVVSVFGILPYCLFSQPSAESLAVAVGGIALGMRAFQSIGAGFTSLSQAIVSWREARGLFRGGAFLQESTGVDVPSFQEILLGTEAQEVRSEHSSDDELLLARGMVFTHSGETTPVLRGVDLSMRRSERILLTGPSGAGKSTLAQILSGLLPIQSGILAIGGLDLASLGHEKWRERVVLSPQFYQNHIFLGTLAFNLLLGRRWPPTRSDLREAEEILYHLGLGELIERMPSGILQIVGETGWQLSHGEQSRIFLARALLQNPDLIILDENFAALDPEHLLEAMNFVRSRSSALIVIAHP